MVGEEPGVSGRGENVRRRRTGLWIAVAVAVVVVGAAVAVPVSLNAAAEKARAETEQRAADEAAAAEAARLDRFRVELGECGVAPTGAGSNVTILDGGEALELLRVTKYDGPTYTALDCLLTGLGAPASVESAIGQTRALDGRQQDEWDGYSIAWSYHPDDGASILIEHAD